MKARLTLKLDSIVIAEAKKMAGARGKSLSSVIEELLFFATKPPGYKETPLEKIRRLSKNVPKLSDEELEAAKKKYLMKKYGCAPKQ